MICKNCYHYELCVKLWGEIESASKDIKNRTCDYFKDKSKVVELPCKVGDTIFVIPSKTNYRLNKISHLEKHNKVYEQEVYKIYFGENNEYIIVAADGLSSVLGSFYKINWFLTKEEAEQALKEYEK